MASRVTLKAKKWKEICRYEFIELLNAFKLKRLISTKIETDTSFLSPVRIKDIDASRRSIIVLPNITWGYRTQRPQHIFSRLAKEGYNIFWVSQFTSNVESIGKIDEHIYQLNIKTLRPGKLLRDFHLNIENAKKAYQSIRNLIGNNINNTSILFTLHPAWFYLTEQFNEIFKIYDLMDLYEGFTESKNELIEQESELIEKSNLVFATAENLLKNAKAINPNSFLIKNGADYDNFKTINGNGELDCVQDKKIVGYFGSLSDWLDIESIEYAANNNPDIIFVFIGKINSKLVRKLYRYQNIFLLGEIKYKDLAGYLAYFDVCLIPFIINDLIHNTDPVKFYEYISAGKPVLTNTLPELEKYRNICYMYKTPNSFNRKLLKALEENDSKIVTKRKIIAKYNSWDKRVKEIISCIEKL